MLEHNLYILHYKCGSDLTCSFDHGACSENLNCITTKFDYKARQISFYKGDLMCYAALLVDRSAVCFIF